MTKKYIELKPAGDLLGFRWLNLLGDTWSEKAFVTSLHLKGRYNFSSGPAAYVLTNKFFRCDRLSE